MNETLFTFPAESGSSTGGDKLFDLSGLTQADGDASENPFAAMLAEGEAAGPKEDANPGPALELMSGSSQTQQTETETENNTVHDKDAQQVKTPPTSQEDAEEMADTTQEDPEENPLMAAINRQEKKNAQKAAEPIFAQLPVFSYNGTQEPIEDLEQTFEELRLAKADDFPEFDEAQSLSWSVSYGKITKSVTQPRKTKIGQFKREIEASKDFVNALKKAADKHPKCVVKPVIHMQKKGEASSYKGAFLSLSDARASQKTISFIPGRDGKVYERRTTNAGEFITPAAPTGAITVLDEIRPGFQSSLPKIPYTLMEQALSLFRTMMHRGKDRRPAEALVHIYWDKLQQQYFIHVPKQLVSRASVDALLDNEALQDSDSYIHYADLHSHNQMPAVFSKTDDHDERPTRVYMVVGRLDRYFPEITVRISNGGHFWEIPPQEVLEPFPVGNFPPEWLNQIHTDPKEMFEVAA